MGKKKIVFIILLVIIGFIATTLLIKNNTNLPITNEITVVPTMNDEFSGNSSWCGTFQLVWNDMVNEVVKQDVEFNPQPKIVENLNKQTFTNRELSPSSYYSKF
jgi:hypothetical protein